MVRNKSPRRDHQPARLDFRHPEKVILILAGMLALGVELRHLQRDERR